MYSNINANARAGKTRQVRGTKIEDTNEAAIVNIPFKQTTNQNELTANLKPLF
jgi:hypothetical protein